MLSIAATNLPYKGDFRAEKAEAYRIFLKKIKSNEKKSEKNNNKKQQPTTIQCSKAGESFRGNLQSFWRMVTTYSAWVLPVGLQVTEPVYKQAAAWGGGDVCTAQSYLLISLGKVPQSLYNDHYP